MLLPTAANAVMLGSDVAESDYKDYVVRIELSNTSGQTETCGGLLIGGEYVLTAGHCIGTVDHSGSTTVYNSFLDSGASNAITVYQGTDYHADKHTTTTYSVVDLVNDDFAALTTEAQTESNSVLSAYPNAGDSTWQTSMASTLNSSARHDIALIHLTDSVSQKSHAKLIPVFDASTNTFNVNVGDTFTFRGWGADENNAMPATMQATTLSVALSDGRTYQYQPNRATSELTQDCVNDAAYNCEYVLLDYTVFEPTTVGATANSGDSGTPLLNNSDEAFALTSSVRKSGGVGISNNFMNIGWYLPYITAAINKVAAPEAIEFSSEDSSGTTTFTVQNLGNTTEAMAPFLGGTNSDNFTVTGCETSIDALASCELTITYTGNTDGDNATVYLGDSNNSEIAISYTIPATDTADGSSDSNDSVSTDGGSGGGSFGFWPLLCLLGCGISRRLKW